MAITQSRHDRRGFGLSRAGRRDGISPLVSGDFIDINGFVTPTQGQPGDLLVWEVSVANTATEGDIPPSDPHACSAGGQVGAMVSVGGGIETGTQIDGPTFCLPVGSSQTVELNVPMPTTPGTYEVSVSAGGTQDAPALFGSFNRSITVSEDAPPSPGGGGDEIFGIPENQAFIALGALGLALGGASLLI